MTLAGVRMTAGSLIWIAGVPPEVNQGAIIRFTLAGEESTGTVSIPSRQIVYSDPDVPHGEFVAIEPLDSTPIVLQPHPPLAVFDSGLAAPDGPGDEALLDLAWRELGRLDR